MNSLIYTGKISGCVKGEYTGRSGGRRSRIQISWGIFGRIKKSLEEGKKNL